MIVGNVLAEQSGVRSNLLAKSALENMTIHSMCKLTSTCSAKPIQELVCVLSPRYDLGKYDLSEATMP